MAFEIEENRMASYCFALVPLKLIMAENVPPNPSSAD
jgi:hypothetical protein